MHYKKIFHLGEEIKEHKGCLCAGPTVTNQVNLGQQDFIHLEDFYRYKTPVCNLYYSASEVRFPLVFMLAAMSQ